MQGTDVADVTRTLTGTGVSSGIAVAPVAQMGAPVTELPPVGAKGDPTVEGERATRALDEIGADLDARKERADGEARDILGALALIARDPALRTKVGEHTASGTPAAHAVDAAIEEFAALLEAAGGYMAERVADLRDLRNRAIARLLHLPMPGIPQRDHPFVLVADDLAPADTVDLDPARCLAVVTARGGPTSHTAIIAKAMGLPAIVSCAGVTEVPDDTTVVVDGTSGVVTIDPEPGEVAAAEQRREDRARLLAESSGPGRTADGHPVQLLLNVGSAGEKDPGDVDAEGVGLLRTEFLFLGRDTEPPVEEQTATYLRLFEQFGGRKVVVRTLDVGADKPLPFVDGGPGENPALGLRGARLSQLNPGLLERQLEAIAAAAEAGPATVWVMAPMIATVEEAAAFVAQAHDVGLATAGVMVEVPGLALRADDLMQVVDFVSIGTNDLSQYTFAADRLVGELGHLLDPWQPALLQLVARTIGAGVEHDVPVGICGEAASDPMLSPVLAGLGVSSLSMAPAAVAEVRAALAGRTLDDCRKLAMLALAATDAGAARRAVVESGIA